MSYNSYKPRYSLYQPVASPVPVHVGGGFAPHQPQYQRRSVSAGNLYRNSAHSVNLGRSPRFAENGFVPAHSSANSSASLAASAAVSVTTTSSTAVVPDRYHRQKHTASLSTHSLPSLTPSIKSSDLDTSSTQTSTSSISSWTDEKDKTELPQIKESAVERIGASLSEPELSRAVLLSERLEHQVDPEPEPVDVVGLVDKVDPKPEPKSEPAVKSPVPKSTIKMTPQVSPKNSLPSQPSQLKATAHPHPSQRTSNQAVEEALAKLNANGGNPPSAEPVRTHRRRSSADSRTSLILPSDRRHDAREKEKRERIASARNSPEKQHQQLHQHQRPRSVLDQDVLRNAKTRASPAKSARPTSATAKTGPVLNNSTPVRPPSSSSIRAASMPPAPRANTSRPPSISSISTSATNMGHSRSGSQFSLAQPIAYAPVRGEREPKPKFSQKIKSLFRRSSTMPDSASISSNMSGMSGKSGLSGMSVRSTSSTFSFRSISQSSKRLFKKTPKIEVSAPTFEQSTPSSPIAAAPLESSQHQSLPTVNQPTPPRSLEASTYGSNPASRSPSPTPNTKSSPHASPIPIRGSAASDINDDQRSLSIQDETLDVPDTLFPRSLDDVAAVAHIRNSVERVASLDRKGSVRSVRSLHKPNDEEKVPNVQEVRMENPEDEQDDDIFGLLDTSGIDLALPKHIKKRGVNFASQVMIYDTFSSFDYDRRPEPATCNRLTPALAQQIKQELNNVKMTMEVHRDSRAYTHFF